MNRLGFRCAWAGVVASGAVALAGACSSSSHDFGNPAGGSSGSSGTSGSSGVESSNGGAAAAPAAGGSDATLGGAGGAGAACTPGETTTCYESEDGKPYKGMPADNQTTCRLGSRQCKEDGTWDVCAGAVGPEAADTCDAGNDANCNGTPNEGCTCSDGEMRTCTAAAGTCIGGEQTCTSSAWGECAGCKLIDGESCVAVADCSTGACTSFYLDADKDGYRADSTVVKFCGATKTGYVAVASSSGDDCDDSKATINPGAAEICDGVDNNCDGKIDMAGNAALKLSGTSKSLIAGTVPAIAAAGALYGIAYVADKTYLITLNQNNTIQLAKTVIDADVAYNTALAWDGASFGIFYKDPTSNYLEFRKATTAGAFSPATRVDVGQPTGGGSYVDYFAVRLPNNTWFMTGWSAFQSDWSWLYTVDDTYVPSAEISITAAGHFPNVAVSGNSVGLVWHGGSFINNSAPPQTLELSVRDKAGLTETKHVQLRDTTAARKPVIAPRSGGGFGVMWSESSGVYVQEFSNTGVSQCGPIYKAFTDFEPDQMVATKRGYLAVSGYNKVAKAQEVLSGCTYGTSFPNIGTSGTNDQHVHLAAGANGFAAVWDDDTNIYARTFGPNLCD